MNESPKFIFTHWSKSCEVCKHQEGNHYCLLHSITVKNMDVKRCPDFEDRGSPKESAPVIRGFLKEPGKPNIDWIKTNPNPDYYSAKK